MNGKKAKLMRKALKRLNRRAPQSMNGKVDKRSKKLYNMLNRHEKTILGLTYKELIAKNS